MITTLRVLLVEDSESDAELLEIKLRRGGFDATVHRVETAEAFSAALDAQAWDLVIADHLLPTFDAPRALTLLKSKAIDLPFVVMSGTIADSLAIEMMRSGANDFVSKGDSARLEPVIRRELQEASNRRKGQQAGAEREEMFARLEIANRVKDEFLAMLGHELRNPLAPIVTALQLMKLRGGGQLDREHSIIDRQVRHLVRLVDDLLDVAKIAKDKLELTRRPVELSDPIAQAVETTSPLFEERKHRLRVEVPARGLLVDADEARLAQVVFNLLANAARYTLPGGEISLTASVEAGEAVVRVKDNGIGIDPGILPRIFDLFVQSERPTDRKVGGLGLGLSLVRSIVALHGGSVAALSAGHDRGSEFIVRLPLAPPVPVKQPTSRPPPRPPPGPRRILLVDDNGDALEMLASALRRHGHEVVVAMDGPSALTVLDGFTPSVMVLDIGLPVMDGHELARRIRARPEHAATRLIALTGYGQASARERSRQAGFDLHLVKPVDFARLLSMMEEPPAEPGAPLTA